METLSTLSLKMIGMLRVPPSVGTPLNSISTTPRVKAMNGDLTCKLGIKSTSSIPPRYGTNPLFNRYHTSKKRGINIQYSKLDSGYTLSKETKLILIKEHYAVP